MKAVQIKWEANCEKEDKHEKNDTYFCTNFNYLARSNSDSYMLDELLRTNDGHVFWTR